MIIHSQAAPKIEFDQSLGGKILAHFFENRKGRTDAKVTLDARKVGLFFLTIILILF